MAGHPVAGARCRSAAVLIGIVLAMGWQTGLAAAAPAAAAPAAAAELFTISGSLSQLLMPGLSEPLDLSVTNPTSDALRLTGLEVTITGVAPLPGLACSSNDFAVTQYSGRSELSVARSTTSRLSDLGVPTDQLPQVQMLETHVNQDGCQGATLDLAYTGTAIGATAGGGTGRGHGHGHGHYDGHGNGYGYGNGHHDGHDNHNGAGNGAVSSPRGALSPTGAEGNAWPITLAGLALVTAGGAACIVVRRRKGTSDDPPDPTARHPHDTPAHRPAGRHRPRRRCDRHRHLLRLLDLDG